MTIKTFITAVIAFIITKIFISKNFPGGSRVYSQVLGSLFIMEVLTILITGILIVWTKI